MNRRQLLALAFVVTILSARAFAGEPGPMLKVFSVFSYEAPSGWSQQVAGGLALGGFPQAVGPASNNFTPDITFITRGYESVAQYVKSYEPTLVDLSESQKFPLKLVDSAPFVTAAGVKGMRLRSVDAASPPVAAQFSYVFNNKDGLVCEFACACAPADAARLLPIFDACMKSVKLL